MFARQMTPSPAPTTPEPESSRLVSADGRTLPLRGAELRAELGGGLARVILTQRFVNPHAEALTVHYTLPLPSDGAVSGFCFYLDDERIVGEVQPRQQARERYVQAIAEGRSAALLDQERTSVFSQHVGNIPPGAEIVAEIIIDQPLAWLEEGAWRWRFPTVVSPRYMGARGRVADADKLAVDVIDPSSPNLAQGAGAAITLSATITDTVQGPPESSSHALRHELDRDLDQTTVRFSGDRGVALDRDISLSWPVAVAEVGVSVLAGRPVDPAHEGDSFALVTLVPPRADVELEAVPRDLLFLIDTSGSMSGRPLDQAKRVIGAMIDTLGPRDRVELIEFGWKARRYQREPVVATREGKRGVKRWLKNLRASGGTEMHEAILAALTPLRADAQRQIVLVTDGQIGFEREIISALRERLPDGVRLHTVGVGSAVNRSLTEAAARAGRGTELVVGLDEDVERVIPRLLARTSAPIVTELRVGGAALIGTAPQALPDLYAGAPVTIAVRYRGEGGQLSVEGHRADHSYAHVIDLPQLTLGEGAQQAAALFARESVEDLETNMLGAAPRRHAEFDDEIERIGVAFQIATRKTSWIAISEGQTVDPGGPRRVERQPQELPYGTSIEGLGLRAAAGPSMSFQRRPSVIAKNAVVVSASMDDLMGGAAPRAAADSPMADSMDFEDYPMAAAAAEPLQPMPSPEAWDRVASPLVVEEPKHQRSGVGWIVALVFLVLLIAGLLFVRCSADEAPTADETETTQLEPTVNPTRDPTNEMDRPTHA